MSASSRRERRRVIVGHEGAGGSRLLSLGRPYLAVVSAPSAPLLSRLLADSRTIAVTRRGPGVVVLLVAVSLPVLTLLGMSSGTDDVLLVAAATAIVGGLVAAPLVIALYAVNALITARLDVAHEALLALVPGVLVGGDDPSLAHALGRIRTLRTPASRAYVERLVGARGPLPTETSFVLSVLTRPSGAGLYGAARRRGDRGVVEDVLALANALPLDAPLYALVRSGTRTGPREEWRERVRTARADVEAGVPLEWALRRADAPVVAP